MSFEKIAEEKIQNAIAAGEFDNLPGKGKPLEKEEKVFSIVGRLCQKPFSWMPSDTDGLQFGKLTASPTD